MHRRGEGWIMFAAIVLAIAGIMRIFDAIWALRDHGVLPEISRAAIFGHSLKTYGWVCLAAATVLILCAFLVLSGSQVGRWVGIVADAIGRISAIWWMPFYPIWSLTYIAMGVLVIYALAAYGGGAEAVWQRAGSAVSLPMSDAAVPAKAAAHGGKFTLGRATTPKTARTGSEGLEHSSWTTLH